MKNYIIAAVVIVVGFLVLSSFPVQQSSELQNGSTEVASVLSLSFKDYDDNTVNLSSFLGKPMVINSWAAWCLFCLDELPDFAEAQKEFGDEVVFIAIDRSEPLETAKKFSDEAGVTDDLIFLLDPRDLFYQGIGGFAMPETIFISKDGIINFHKRGPMKIDEIRRRTQEILN